MAAKRGITLYHSPASRAFIAYWMLEELGVPFDVQTVDIAKGEQKDPRYLKINPSGKVPALTDGAATVSETPAICIFLADRYGYGTLAPRIEDPRRGEYLRWMVYAASVLDPVAELHSRAIDLPGGATGFGTYDDMVRVLETALSRHEYIAGDAFTAADVALGGGLSMLLYNRKLPESPALLDYNARLAARPACQRAADATWPAQLFPPAG
ncbi:glutathione S-transferase family protein [uncultured Phenylobacterium sp.]|uniref:glutathione S-transferase family protein n=1 Tax=uncultured Phenylobacterium sp. TaxID=349273 RepID=UPI0025CD0790|nr:glutathione S-transferase family protein [uncultured Phenylobacterium sp.]